MTDTQWGPPLTGEQVGRLNIPWGTPCMQGDVECVIQSYFVDPHGKEEIRLPADHIAYKVIKAGWLDKPNVRLWFGGDKAPDDWDGGACLLRNGDDEGYAYKDCLSWRDDGAEYDIIAYIAKAEEEYMPEIGADFNGIDISGVLQNMAETVTIATMTVAEAKAWCMTFHHNDRYAAYDALDKLGLVRPTPEPTRAERFWQGKERHSLYHDEGARALIDAALEFER